MEASLSQFRMIDVGEKEITRRRAIAQGKILLSSEAYDAICENRNPKGNVLALAEAAGIMAAKKTAEWIPLCHPLPIDQIKVDFTLSKKDHSILVRCEVRTSAKTGVEMEALCGVQGALLTVYDLSKAVDPTITLSDIRLELKEGGKSGKWVHPQHSPTPEPSPKNTFSNFRISAITISDRAFAGKMEDRSGPTIKDFFEKRGGQTCFQTIVPDDPLDIQAAIRKAIHDHGCQLVITTGGTGVGPRDQTPEALEELFDRTIPGMGECLRKEGAKQTPFSWLSRSTAGVLNNALVIALPGSQKAVQEGLETLEEFLPHCIEIIAGGKHE